MSDELLGHIIEIKALCERLDERTKPLPEVIDRLSQRVNKLEGDKKYVWGFGGGITFLLSLLELILHRSHK